MLLYIILLNYYLIAALFEKFLITKLDNNKSKLFLWNIFIAIPIWFIISFRDVTVGNDTVAYQYLFRIHSNLSLKESLDYSGMEKLFVVILNVLGHMGFSYYGYQLLVSTILCIMFGIYIYRYSLNTSLSWFFFITLLYMSRCMNITREMLAVALSVIAFRLVIEQKIVSFIVFCIISFFIHKTAIFQLLILPFLFIKRESSKYFLTMIIILNILIFFDKFTTIFILAVDKYSYILDSKYMDTIGGYAKYINLIFVSLILFWFHLSKKHYNKGLNLKYNKLSQEYEVDIWQIYLMIALIFSFAGLKFGLADRCALYFTLPFIVLLPNMLRNLSNKGNRIVLTILIILICYIYFIVVLIFRNEWHTIMPYSTWLI